METITGRKDEIQQLNRLADSPKSEFVALYGRRRVGKTYLVNHVFKNRLTFSMSGVLEGTLKDQLLAFTDAMDDYGFDLPEKPSDWMSAFVMLKKALKKRKFDDERCIIFIDELPAMDAENSNVAAAVGYFWNSWASLQEHLTLIICGSATSWMISNVIDSKGGLHDRLTEEMHIHPFTLCEVEQYLDERKFVWNRMMKLQAYMIFGGIPYYLSLLDNQESLAQNIDRMFFGKNMLMRREFRRLFSTLYKNPSRYIDIVKRLAESRMGLTREQIAVQLGAANNGHLGNQLEDLVNCDLVRKNVVMGKNIKRKDAIYQLRDFFSLFFLTFIERAEQEQNYWFHHINTPEVNTWMGLAYERVCMEHIPQIKKGLRVDGISTVSYSWRSRKSVPAVQIDLIIQRADLIVNVCEVKFSQDQYVLGKEEYEKIIRLKNTFVEETGIRHTPWLTIITTEGLAKGQYAAAIPSQLTLDDLFQD